MAVSMGARGRLRSSEDGQLQQTETRPQVPSLQMSTEDKKMILDTKEMIKDGE